MKRIGVKQIEVSTNNNLKRDIIFFDELILEQNNLDVTIEALKVVSNQIQVKSLLNDIELLQKNGLVQVRKLNDIEFPVKNHDSLEGSDKHINSLLKIKELSEIRVKAKDYLMNYSDTPIKNPLNNRLTRLKNHQTLSTRLLSNILNIYENQNMFTPIISEFHSDFGETSMQNTKIIKVVLNKLPIIDKSTSWEQVLEFKSDTETNKKLLALKNWMTDLSSRNLHANEISEKIDHLLNEYESHLILHRLKYENGSLQMIITTSLEVLENIARLQFSKISKSIFSFQEKELQLMIAERSAPGRELAFLGIANTHFKNK